MVDGVRLTRAQLAKAVGGDPQVVRALERVISGAQPIRVASGNTDISAADRYIMMADPGTATLPRAGDIVGAVYTVKRLDGGPVVLAAQPGETINGNPSINVTPAHSAETVVSTGTEWFTV